MNTYLTEYFGPAFFIASPLHKIVSDPQMVYRTCGNIHCNNYKKSDNSMHKYCPLCGDSLKNLEVFIERKMGIYDSKDENADLIIYPFNLPATDILLFIPDFDTAFGKEIKIHKFFAYKEVDKLCQNKKCQDFEFHVPYTSHYCTSCGGKVEFEIDERVESNFTIDLINDIKNSVRQNRIDEFAIVINDDRFKDNLEVFKQNDLTLKALKVLEEVYGVNSVVTDNYYLQYNEGY